jgi:hypothetical protein
MCCSDETSSLTAWDSLMPKQGTFILPGTLWMAAVLGRWREVQHGPDSSSGGGLMSWGHAVVLACLLYLHMSVLSRLGAGYGALSIMLSPGVGWVVPLAGLWLHRAHWHTKQPRCDDAKAQ